MHAEHIVTIVQATKEKKHLPVRDVSKLEVILGGANASSSNVHLTRVFLSVGLAMTFLVKSLSPISILIIPLDKGML